MGKEGGPDHCVEIQTEHLMPNSMQAGYNLVTTRMRRIYEDHPVKRMIDDSTRTDLGDAPPLKGGHIIRPGSDVAKELRALTEAVLALVAAWKAPREP